MCDILRYDYDDDDDDDDDDDLGRGVKYVALPVPAFTGRNGLNHKTISRRAR
jgi:hypothetical protein